MRRFILTLALAAIPTFLNPAPHAADVIFGNPPTLVRDFPTASSDSY